MEEMRQIAKAYYDRAKQEDRVLARHAFQSFDKNGDGKISFEEFKEEAGEFDPNGYYFKQIDENGDGTLDFEEFLALFYLCKAGIPQCDGCLKILSGNYFSCMLCLGKISSNSYDLCCKCYTGEGLHHQHSSKNFVDLHARNKLLIKIIKKSRSQGAAMRLIKSFNKGYRVGTAIGRVGTAIDHLENEDDDDNDNDSDDGTAIDLLDDEDEDENDDDDNDDGDDGTAINNLDDEDEDEDDGDDGTAINFFENDEDENNDDDDGDDGTAINFFANDGGYGDSDDCSIM